MGLAKPQYTYEQYLAMQETSEEKLEYLRGEVFAMTGGTPTHARLASSAGRHFANALDGAPCFTYSSDLRVRIVETDRSTYPDLAVVCGRVQLADDDRQAATNPTVIVEVMSPTTELSDRGEKWAHYRRIPSLRDYVLLAQDRPYAEHFHRNDAGIWEMRELGTGGALATSVATVAMDLIYQVLEADPLSPIGDQSA